MSLADAKLVQTVYFYLLPVLRVCSESLRGVPEIPQNDFSSCGNKHGGTHNKLIIMTFVQEYAVYFLQEINS